MTKLIPLTKGQFAIVDDEDYDWLVRWKWQCRASEKGRRLYAGRTSKAILMHRVIMNAPREFVIDHIDGNGLNNQRHNLRVCTYRQNQQNQRIQQTSKTSCYKGVSWSKETNKWSVAIRVDGRLTRLGYFIFEPDAGRAYDVAALQHFGEFARLNFPQESE